MFWYGTNAQVLSTDGSGNLTWEDQTGGVGAGNIAFDITGSYLTPTTTQNILANNNLFTVGDLSIFGGDLNLGTGSATTTLTSASGNLGIGTTSPYAKLSVVGETVAEYFTATSTTATSTFPYLTSTQSNVGTVVGGTWQGNTVGTAYGGTGLTSYTPNQLLYASDANTIGQIATSSLGLLTTNVAEGSNLYWTDNRFDVRLAASTTIPTITTLSGLTTIGTIGTGVWQGTEIGVTYGGTGLTSAPSYGNILVGNASSGYTLTATSSLGLIESQWITTGPDIYYNTGNVGIGTTSPATKLSVAGDILGNWIYADHFIATSTTATSTIAGGLNVGSGGLVYDYSSNNTWFNNGNVGIGTSSPYAKLSVWGDGNGDGTSTSTAFSVIDSASSTLFSILDNGIIDVGNTANLGKLSVAHTDINGAISRGLDIRFIHDRDSNTDLYGAFYNIQLGGEQSSGTINATAHNAQIGFRNTNGNYTDIDLLRGGQFTITQSSGSSGHTFTIGEIKALEAIFQLLVLGLGT